MFPFMNYHYFVEYYLRNYSPGGRTDYLARVISLSVATPEEQEEWFHLMRPRVLECWEKDLEYFHKEAQQEIIRLRQEAVRSRNGRSVASLYWAHKYELQADYLEQRLNNGSPTTHPPEYKGYYSEF